MKVVLPSDIEELWNVLDNDPRASILAGGTDLFVKIRAGSVQPAVIAGLERLEELRVIRDEGDTVLIGACATHTDILGSPVVAAFLPVLRDAVHVLGSPPVRNMATLGGNICTASPAGDTLPPLYAMDARVELRSRKGVRRMAIGDFITGPGRTVLEEGEILTGIEIDKPMGPRLSHFEKVGQRKAMSISIASLAALLWTDASGSIERIALAWGSVGPTVIRSSQVEALLIGERPTVEGLKGALPLIREAVSPIDDVRASADYRKTVSANLLLRLSSLVDGR